MNNTELNNFINEFMSNTKELTTAAGGVVEMYMKDYTRSLDLLTSVWGKLGIIEIVINHLAKGGYEVQLNTKKTVLVSCDIDIFGQGETIQEAAAQATAKAILELRNENG